MDEITTCLAVCTKQIYIYISILGLIFGIISIILFLLRKKVPAQLFKILLGISGLIFLFFSIQVEYETCGSGCSSDGIYFEGIQFIPENKFPFIIK